MALTPWNRQEEWYQEMIDAIGEGGGSGLPEVTSADNGKVATVVGGAWTAWNSVYIIECDRNNSPLTASEIRAIAQSGMYPVLHYYDAYWLYAVTDNNHAYFTKLLYGSPSDQKFYVNVAFVNSNKGVNKLLDKKVYTINSTGIPESDLAQAVKNKLNKFVVTLTPTAADYSGTMDKTPQEITEAYNAGQTISFVIHSFGAAFDAFEFVTAGPNVQAGSVLTYRVGSSHLLIECLTSNADDDSTYTTHIYTLTPAT